MATRIYPTTGTPGITPTASTGWEATSDMVRYAATITAASFSDASVPATSGSGNANEDTVCFQLVYGPLSAQTITGNIKGQISARESNAAADARVQVIVRTIASDGTTVRGTNLAMSTAGLSHEFFVDAGTRRNITLPLGGSTALTSVSAQAGDYVVVEVGFRNHGTNTGEVRERWTFGGAESTDAPEDETTTTTSVHRGWVEFSNTLTPLTAAPATAAAGTGAASNANLTIKPTAGVASGTGAANNATVSYVPPPRSVTINGSDYIGDALYSGFSLTECANRGEVGTGGFDVIDGISALDIPAMKALQFNEPLAGASNQRVFTGFTHDRTETALPDSALTAKVWAVEAVDLNILASDYVLTDAEGADRPAETDYVRVAWLLTTALNSVGGVGVGVVPNANTVTMEATDYRGRKAADLLAECSEATQKLWFIYDYGAGRKLYYDLATGTSLSSSVFISDVAGEPDGATVFAVQSVQVKRSPDRIYSKVHYTYNEGTVTVSDAGVAAAYRQREAAVLDASVTDVTLATTKANALLAGSSTEIVEIEGLEIVCSAAHVNDIRPGQRVQIKLTRHNIDAYAYYRVVRRTVQPMQNTTHYLVALGLADNVLASANGERGGDEIWPQKSNANDDGATVIVDRSGINIIDGAITVVNSSATVIIDGESDIFKVAAAGTVQTASRASAGTSTVTADIATGLTYSPTCELYMQSTYSFPCPYVVWGTGTGLMAFSYQGGAAVTGGNQTRVYAETSTSTTAIARDYQYYVFSETAF